MTASTGILSAIGVSLIDGQCSYRDKKSNLANHIKDAFIYPTSFFLATSCVNGGHKERVDGVLAVYHDTLRV